MDKLAELLRNDAEKIEVVVSPELDRRIEASIHAAAAERSVESPTPRSTLFWWASSLTGVAAAILLIVAVNKESTPAPESSVADNAAVELELPELPRLPLKVEAAMTADPLQQELDDLEADLEKARDAVREDVRTIF